MPTTSQSKDKTLRYWTRDPLPDSTVRFPSPEKVSGLAIFQAAKNLPFGELIDANGCLKSEDELAKIFEGKGIDPTKPTVNSCGSGVTACILDLALSVMGGQKSAIYDGSWTEYVSLLAITFH